MNDFSLKMSVDRGFTWMDDETIALIDIWGKDDVQAELNGSKRNFAVYERIARELSDIGFSRTAYQCREKIKRLRKEYQIAKYCVQHNISQKKPMKHFELVDQVFNRESHPCNDIPCSDQEDEVHFAFNPEQESDASNSCTGPESGTQAVILPGPSCSISSNGGLKMKVKVKPEARSPSFHNDSNDTLIVNGENDMDTIDKDSALEDSDSPWVPNVVLVEKDSDVDGHCRDDIGQGEGADDVRSDRHSSFRHPGHPDSPVSVTDSALEDGDSPWVPNVVLVEKDSDVDGSCRDDIGHVEATDDGQSDRHSSFRHPGHPESVTGDDEPPYKKRRRETKGVWFKKMLDKVTDRFVRYQEEADTRFLERIACLEQERMKRDESMQRLWMEFEERRRKEEQQHELKMMMLFGQFVNQVLGGENPHPK